uniref:DUF6892 domain-containing protein n=1 Tax=Massilia sp. W12 TaxID=3126507 RepID=UPI00403FA8C9
MLRLLSAPPGHTDCSIHISAQSDAKSGIPNKRPDHEHQKSAACIANPQQKHEYSAREIQIEKEGYAIVPEALAYFAGLLIPPALLEQVSSIGFDGGNKVYRQIFLY